MKTDTKLKNAGDWGSDWMMGLVFGGIIGFIIGYAISGQSLWGRII